MKIKLIRLFVALALLALPALVQAQFTFTTNNGAITITGYNTAAGLNAVIPSTTNGYPVTIIGDSAFENCYNLRTVTIPASVTSIGDDAFFACYYLASPTIPDSVTNIGTYAFDFCDNLASITIPASVTSIGEGAFLTPVLTNISVSDVNPAYSSLNGVLFNKAKDTLVQYPEVLRNNAYTIPGTVTSIADIAFDGCTYLASVSIPGTVTSIGWAAFQGCSSLTSITIPNAVTNIGNDAFDFCSGLTNVTICNSVTSIGDYAFEYCTSLANINLGTNVTSIGAHAFSSTAYRGVITGDPLHNVTIPDSVTSIGDSAFSTCGYLTNVTIGNGVTNIGDNAFDSCYSLNNVTIGKSVTTIGAEAFNNCGLMTSITIPSNVTNIGYSAFYDCFSLTSVYFLGNAPPDDGFAFFNDPATVYYLAGTIGWGSTFGSVPAVLWNPQATAMSLTGGQFGFTLTGPSSAVIVVEACTNLSHPVWLPVSTNTLSGSGTSAFTDPTGYPMRFYRFRSP